MHKIVFFCKHFIMVIGIFLLIQVNQNFEVSFSGISKSF